MKTPAAFVPSIKPTPTARLVRILVNSPELSRPTALANLRRDGSVESAALVQTFPLGGSSNDTGVCIEGAADAGERQPPDGMVAGPGYLQTLRIPLLAGHDFTDADSAGAPKAAIVNKTLVKRYWPNCLRARRRRFMAQ